MRKTALFLTHFTALVFATAAGAAVIIAASALLCLTLAK